MNQGSRRIVEALADIAEVLAPEQRVELVELAERFHGRRWHR
jgi:Spy/CpxP family protein refolding chaperone